MTKKESKRLQDQHYKDWMCILKDIRDMSDIVIYYIKSSNLFDRCSGIGMSKDIYEYGKRVRDSKFLIEKSLVDTKEECLYWIRYYSSFPNPQTEKIRPCLEDLFYAGYFGL
jgi:hypothetical protein